MGHPGRVMWGCVAVVGVAVALALAYSAPAVLLFVLPCAVMLGAMVWMMRGGSGGGSDHGRR